MSGFEVVGVVLGALPLVISGLEHYADGVRVIKVICNASRDFKTLARKLRAEETVYRNTLAILLDDCVAIESQTHLIQNPGGDEWNDLNVKAALKTRLGQSHESFVEHVKSIHTALEGLRDRLHIDSSGKGPFEDAKSFRQAYKRFHFALQKSAYLDLIDNIRDDNTHIQRLTEQSQVLQSRRNRRTPDYDHIRTGASSIFEILQHGLQVSCGAPHKASIYLRPVGGRESKFDIAQREADDSFRIVLHHDGNTLTAKQKAPPWYLQEAEMRLLDNLASPVLPSPTPAACPNRKRKVQFSDPSGPSRATNAIKAVSSQQKLDEIRDLCHSIEKMRSMQCGICLGYMMGVSNQHRHGLYWPKDRLIDPSSLTVSTLASVLEGQGKSTRKLTSADAHRLAVPLASWMLRLHDTPWLMSTWGKGDITLIQQNGKVLAEHAFITQSLKPKAIAQSTSPSAQNRIAALVIRNPTLFALGVILIELCMGQTIDELQSADELNPDGTKHELSDYQTADRLLKMEEISDRFGKRWSDVVRRCVYCDLNQSRVCLGDTAFRSAVHNDIVAELEEDYKQFFHL